MEKIIEDHPDYSITDKGEVYSYKYGLRKKKVLTIKKDGYVRTCLKTNNERYNVYIHRLVAEAFIPNPEKKFQVNHKNFDRADNKVENLEWVTASENLQYTVDNGRYISPMKGKFGKENPKSKPVVQIDKTTNKIIASFESRCLASKATGVSSTLISGVCLKKHKTAGGYRWKSKEDI